MEDGGCHPAAGTPQGGVISLLLSNIYLHVLDRVWAKHGAHLGELVRYADDFVVLCGNASDCEEAQARIGHVLGRLAEAAPTEDATRGADGWLEGFDFLGCHLRKRMSGRLGWVVMPVVCPYRWSEPAGDEACAGAGAELTPTWRCHQTCEASLPS
ncbi:MAG: hypothetical protein IPN37_19870 [Betaproteobacteria bacterium]|nr:hypothetical protein [Betaproteobacteria bacterium]